MKDSGGSGGGSGVKDGGIGIGRRPHLHKTPSPKWKLQVVLTKCDLVERNDLARRMAAVHAQLRCTFARLVIRMSLLHTGCRNIPSLTPLNPHFHSLIH